MKININKTTKKMKLNISLFTIACFFLCTLTVNAQSWQGKWKTRLGELTLVESRGKLYSVFTLKSDTQSEKATLRATINGKNATGNVETKSGKLYFKWTLASSNKIIGRSAFNSNQVESSYSTKFDATRISITPSRKFAKKRTPIKVYKKPKQLEIVDPELDAKLDNFNKKRKDNGYGSSAGRTPITKKTTKKTESKTVNDELKTSLYRVTVVKLGVTEPNNTFTRNNPNHEVYGTIGIRGYKKIKGKYVEQKNTQNLKPRVWDVNGNRAKTVKASASGVPIGGKIVDPTGLSFWPMGYTYIKKSRIFKFSNKEITDGAQVNIQFNLAESDPGIDDNFPWKQRSLSIKKMTLGEEYLLIQSEEDKKSYKIAITFKVEKI